MHDLKTTVTTMEKIQRPNTQIGTLWRPIKHLMRTMGERDNTKRELSWRQIYLRENKRHGSLFL
jgi:hypothetical protein